MQRLFAISFNPSGLCSVALTGQTFSQGASSQCWQATGWKLEAGKSYRITATGQFQIANDGQPWPCEPNGVTVEYHDGMPLGVLLGAIASSKPSEEDPSFAKPMLIGSEAVIQPKSDGVLCLRINDSPAKLGDNAGSVEVGIAPQ